MIKDILERRRRGPAAWRSWIVLTLLAWPGYPVLADTPGIEGPDPYHESGPTMPPPELGLPPTPTGHTVEPEQFPVPPPPFESDLFPCMACHEDMTTNFERRVLKEDHAGLVLHHGEENRWCLDCHDADNRDMLRLASGELISFEVSYRLCGQCHGTQYREWKVGIHGKRTGMWNGKKEYLLCAHCHYPHNPKFQPIVPESAPARPEDIR